MNPADPLAQLHPLREPDVIGWWPLAPGWWLLLVLLLGLLLGAGYLLWRRHRARAYRRQGLRQLEELFNRLQHDHDLGAFTADTNALLKSVALAAYPRRDIAGASGQAWLDWLNEQLPTERQFPAAFQQALYSGHSDQLDVTGLRASAAHWIQHHKVAA